MLNNKNILITGGTGSFGQKFVNNVLLKYKPKRLIIFSKLNPNNINDRKFSPKKYICKIFYWRCKRYERLKIATRDIDVIVHVYQ